MTTTTAPTGEATTRQAPEGTSLPSIASVLAQAHAHYGSPEGRTFLENAMQMLDEAPA